MTTPADTLPLMLADAPARAADDLKADLRRFFAMLDSSPRRSQAVELIATSPEARAIVRAALDRFTQYGSTPDKRRARDLTARLDALQ